MVITNCNSERRRLSDLCRDRLHDADDLLRTARRIAELMPVMDMEHPAPTEPDFERLREFYAGLAEKLDALVPRLKEEFQREGMMITDSLARTILPRVYFLAPDFPFARLLDPFEDEEDHQAALAAVAPYIEEVKEQMKP